MSIDTNDLIALRRAFPRADHEFVRGFVYLTEEAITNRIEEVDPSWTFSVNRMENVDNNAVCHATLIIKDVARDGIGMQQILEKSGEPAKGAATDALKRCSRLFGIGRYLLDAPKEGAEFNGWLAEQQKRLGVSPAPAASLPPTSPVPTPPAPTQAPQPAPVVAASKNAPTAPINASGDFDALFTPPPATLDMPQIGTLNMTVLLNDALSAKLVKQRNHFIRLINKLVAEGSVRDAMTAGQVLDAMRAHEAAKETA